MSSWEDAICYKLEDIFQSRKRFGAKCRSLRKCDHWCFYPNDLGEQMIDKLPQQGGIILISPECVFPIFYRTRFTTRRPGTAAQPHSHTATGLSQLNPSRFAWPFLWQVGHESAWHSYAHGSRKRWAPIIPQIFSNAGILFWLSMNGHVTMYEILEFLCFTFL